MKKRTTELTWGCSPRPRCHRRRGSSPSLQYQQWRSAWRRLNPTSGKDHHTRPAGFGTHRAWTLRSHLRERHGQRVTDEDWKMNRTTAFIKRGSTRAAAAPLGTQRKEIRHANVERRAHCRYSVSSWCGTNYQMDYLFRQTFPSDDPCIGSYDTKSKYSSTAFSPGLRIHNSATRAAMGCTWMMWVINPARCGPDGVFKCVSNSQSSQRITMCSDNIH